MLATCIYMQHLDLLLQYPDKTLATFVWQMKHLEHTIETYVYSHYNMCNILIYFCNIDIQHLQHTSKTSETLAICAFSLACTCCLAKWRLIDMELNAGTKLEATEWHGDHWCGARWRHEPRQEQVHGHDGRRESGSELASSASGSPCTV
jgi:hypothetical protein